MPAGVLRDCKDATSCSKALKKRHWVLGSSPANQTHVITGCEFGMVGHDAQGVAVVAAVFAGDRAAVFVGFGAAVLTFAEQRRGSGGGDEAAGVERAEVELDRDFLRFDRAKTDLRGHGQLVAYDGAVGDFGVYALDAHLVPLALHLLT